MLSRFEVLRDLNTRRMKVPKWVESLGNFSVNRNGRQLSQTKIVIHSWEAIVINVVTIITAVRSLFNLCSSKQSSLTSVQVSLRKTRRGPRI